MSKLKRFGIGVGITTVVMGCLTGCWYKGHYVLPPVSEHSVDLPTLNGFDTLQEAIGLAVMEKDGVPVVPKMLSYSPPRYKTYPLAARLKLVTANEPALRKTREALAQVYVIPPGTDSTKLGKSQRDQARMQIFAGDTYAAAGNLSDAAICYADAIEMGVAIPHGGDMMPFLYGYTCEAMGVRALDRVVDRLEIPIAQGVAGRLEHIATERVPFSEVLQAQNRALNQDMRTLFTGNPFAAWQRIGETYNGMLGFNSFFAFVQGEDSPPPPSFQDRAMLTGIQALVTYQGPGPTITELDRYMRQMEALSRLPWGPERPVLQEPSGGLKGNLIAQLIGPVYAQLEYKDREERMYLSLLQIKLLLHATFLQTGHYPKTLKNLPIDPFSPTNSPLKYHSNGKSYTLWSVGPDAKDDNGTPVPSRSKDKTRRPYINITSKGDVLA
ncbi:MAG: hypothetical protein QM758_07230 [Armatimonas sp.]